MKIGIHNEPCGGGLGGSEVSVAVLAEALAKNHEVEIMHHRPPMTAESLAEFADVDLHGVRLRLIPLERVQGKRAWSLWGRYRAEREQEAELSRDYDIFISFNHGAPPFCVAPVGVLMVLFPSFDTDQIGLESVVNSLLGGARQRLRSAWLRWKFQSRLRGYQVRAANSEFTRLWTKRRWKTDCTVVFPPVDVDFEPGQKSDCILSVGRFAVSGHGKKQIEMLRTFKQLRASGYVDWHYDSVGGCGSSEAEQAFLKEVTQMGADCKANIVANVGYKQLKSLYQRAKIFWHAAGMNVNENLHPELAEHFGMTTVEAMAAGCVPVVINKGGQPEIVEHGISGFLWNTPEEWQQYTIRLMQDDALFQKMSKAARNRAQLFSREAYVRRFQSLFAP